MTFDKVLRGRRIQVLVGLVACGAAAAWMMPGQSASAQGAAVKHRMTRITDTIYRAEPVTAVEGTTPRDDGAVNVRKSGSDEQDIWVRLHRIVS